MVANADGEIADLPARARQIPSLSAIAWQRARVVLVQGTRICREISEGLAPRWEQEVRFVDSISTHGKSILTLTSSKANKGRALAYACADLGVSPAQIIAFGDAENDIGMFEAAGFSYAMGQASKAVKRAACAVTARNDEDGVARAVEEKLRAGEDFPMRCASRPSP